MHFEYNPDDLLIFGQLGKRHEGLQKLVDALPAIRHKVNHCIYVLGFFFFLDEMMSSEMNSPIFLTL